MVETVALGVLAAALALLLYAYAGYPALLWLLGRVRRRTVPEASDVATWPVVSITVPAYNEEHQIRELVESLLALDYPRDRLQILIVSDGSTDRTDEIVSEYLDRGVELLRMPERGGKTAAENAAAEHLRGEIVVNTDASIRIRPDALEPMIAAFRDPEIGLASGRDVSVGPDHTEGDTGESGYVGYEMGVRRLETRVAGIIGASGCFYAIRPELHRIPLPGELSRDFAAALHTIEHGYRPVSVHRAVCYVPRTTSLHREFRRKIRTIARGMATLWYKRSLLNPFRYGIYAWMIASHKLARWLLPWAALASFAALAVLAPTSALAGALFAGGLVVLLLAGVGWVVAGRREPPRLLAVPAFLVAGNLAAARAFVGFLRGRRHATWEPTRRKA